MSANTQNPSEGSRKSEECSSTVQTDSSSSVPKKRLMISLSEKEKLLNWDVLVTPEEPETKSKSPLQQTDQVELVVY